MKNIKIPFEGVRYRKISDFWIRSLAILIVLFPLETRAFDGENHPFEVVNRSLAGEKLVSIYVLPLIRYPDSLDEGKDLPKEPQLVGRKAIGLIEGKEDVKLFSKFFLSASDLTKSDGPQLWGNEFKLVMIVKSSEPRIALRAFKERGVWFLLIEDPQKESAPIRHFRKCSQSFSDFLSRKMISLD